ncbi:hypothetical protein, partial [Helicobacter sp. CLO-3]|uniref:hypothetical protein n=1 Tax=Helicobacter sp. CLO-3 TaxID=211 RepID=UPI00115FAEA0
MSQASNIKTINNDAENSQVGHVFFGCDENYIKYAAVTIQSIIANINKKLESSNINDADNVNSAISIG